MLMHFTVAALPLTRLYRFSISLQRCHLSDFIALVPVYSCATCQTLWHFFQFTARPFARLYFIGFSLDFIALVSVYSRATGQTLLHWFHFQLAVLTLVKLYFIISACSPAACQTLLHWFQFTALPLTSLYCIIISLQRCHLPDFTAFLFLSYFSSVYIHATCQTLLHWFLLTTIPPVRLYSIGLSWQSRRLSDFIS